VLVRIGDEAKQHVLQVVEGREAHEFAALDKRVQERGTASALEAAGEEPMRSTDRDVAERILGAVVVDGQAAVIDIAWERGPRVREIAKRVAHGRRRQRRADQILSDGVDLREEGRAWASRRA